jgi:hypothetical protein
MLHVSSASYIPVQWYIYVCCKVAYMDPWISLWQTDGTSRIYLLSFCSINHVHGIWQSVCSRSAEKWNNLWISIESHNLNYGLMLYYLHILLTTVSYVAFLLRIAGSTGDSSDIYNRRRVLKRKRFQFGHVYMLLYKALYAKAFTWM